MGKIPLKGKYYKVSLSRNDTDFLLHFPRFEDKALVSYYGEIQVGDPKDGSPQKFMMLFDTGSSEFFIPSENCKSDECNNHNKYRFSKNFKQTLSTSNLEVK